MSALTINGAYLGLVDGFERSAELEPSDGVFCEVKPCGEFLPVRFCFDEQFLLSPPPQVQLYYTRDAVAVYIGGFLRADQSLKVLWQERLGNALLTLTVQGKIQLNLETEQGFHIVPLPDAFESCTAEEMDGGFLLRGEGAFVLLSRAGEVRILSEGSVLSTDGPLKAVVPFHDCLGHSAVCEWSGGELISCAVRTAGEPTEATFALALFESALIGADIVPFLADGLREKAGSLKEYLGDYRSVVLTEERDRVGLAYPRKERVFDVRYFRVEIDEGKVSNIKPL